MFEGRKGKELGMVVGLDGVAAAIGQRKELLIAAVVLGLLALFLRFIRKEQIDVPLGKKIKCIWAFFVIIVFAGVAFCFWDVNIGGHEERYGELSRFFLFDDNWGTDRGFVWRFAIELYNQFPLIHKIFGYGADTFGILTTQYNGDTMVRMYTEFGVYYDNAHNAYLQYLVMLGAAGLAAYVLFLASSIAWMVRKGRLNPYVIACVFGAACYLAQSTVNIELPGVTPAFWTVLAVGLAAARGEVRKRTEKTSHN